MIKYYHQLRNQEIKWLIKEKTSYSELGKDFPQPQWCTEVEALHPLGCWSLQSFSLRKLINKKYCKNCDSAKHYKQKDC